MLKVLILITAALLMAMPVSSMAATKSSGTITMEFDLSGHPADQETKLWIPYPLSDRDQLVTNVAISGDYAESAVYSDSKYSTPMLMPVGKKVRTPENSCSLSL